MKAVSFPKLWALPLAMLVPMATCTPSLVASLAEEAVVSYPAPQGEKASQDYQVEADGKQVFVYTAPVLHGGPASFASFDLRGPVRVTVTVAQKIEALNIRPASAGITPSIAARIKFPSCSPSPANLTIEPNRNGERPLHLFANPPETDPPDPASKDVIYFGPGVHEVTTIRPKSGQTIYLAGGAVLRAKIAARREADPGEELAGEQGLATADRDRRRQGREGLRPRDSRPGNAALACADRHMVWQFRGHSRRGDRDSRCPGVGRGDAQFQACRGSQREGNLRT